MASKDILENVKLNFISGEFEFTGRTIGKKESALTLYSVSLVPNIGVTDAREGTLDIPITMIAKFEEGGMQMLNQMLSKKAFAGWKIVQEGQLGNEHHDFNVIEGTRARVESWNTFFDAGAGGQVAQITLKTTGYTFERYAPDASGKALDAPVTFEVPYQGA